MKVRKLRSIIAGAALSLAVLTSATAAAWQTLPWPGERGNLRRCWRTLEPDAAMNFSEAPCNLFCFKLQYRKKRRARPLRKTSEEPR